MKTNYNFEDYGNEITIIELSNIIKEKKKYATDRSIKNEINRLISLNIISKINPNLFRIGKINRFDYEFDSCMSEISKEINDLYPNIDFCLWNVSLLNFYLNHLINVNIIVLEVEKVYIDFIFDFLKDNHNILKNPTSDELTNYSKPGMIVLRPLLTKSPIDRKNNKIKLEKLIVDIYSDKFLNHYYEGAEKITMYEIIFNNYAINYKTLSSYAKRRNVYNDLVNYIRKNNLVKEDYFE